MNSKMRHTAHLLIGKELACLAPSLKQYTLMYGAGDASEYLQVLSVQNTADNVPEVKCWVNRPIREEVTFTSGLEHRYHVGEEHTATLPSAATQQQYFVELFNRTVTIENPGETGEMNLCLYVCLYDQQSWQLAQCLIDAVHATGKPFQIDILGLPAELAVLLSQESTPAQEVAEQLPAYRDVCRQTARQIIQHPHVHRLLLFEDSNTKGLALNLDRDSLIRICGEFAQILVEAYPAVFPANQIGNHIDVTTLGISMLAFDKVYFVDYLLHNAYLEILGREKVQEHSVNVNQAAQVAGQLLDKHVHLYRKFEHDHIEPLIAEQKSQGGLSNAHIHQLEAELQRRIDFAVTDLQSFITDESLSLPQKQAIMAQLLGEDDALLQGVQYQKGLLTIDDCDAETINMFIAEDNKQIRTVEATETTPAHTERGVLTTPTDEQGHVYLPLEEMKHLRAQIRQRAAFKRQKEEELAMIDLQVEEVQESQKRISDGYFSFGDKVFRLLPRDNETKLFETNYTPKPTSEQNVDLRASFTEVKNQGNMGACTAFALVSIFEHIIKSANPSNPNLSEMFAYYNALKLDTQVGKLDPDLGSSFFEVVRAMSESGVCSEELCPYGDGDKLIQPSEQAYEEAKSRLVKCAQNVEVSHHAITSALAEGYPVAISLRLFDSFQADANGFVYRPTAQEIQAGDTGNHAMVVCGFSEEDKVYIVRNSWGTKFGDRGYCYIPFSYIDDPDLCNQACIITDVEVSEKIQVGGLGKKKRVVSFNLTDDGIRAAILRILIDEEARQLDRDNARYAQLRYSYEQLIQTLSNPSTQDQIFEHSITRLNEEISTLNQQYQEFVNHTRPEEIEAFRRDRRATLVVGTCVLLGLSLLSAMFYYFDFPNAGTTFAIIAAIALVLFILYIWQNNHKRELLYQELDERGGNIKLRIAKLENEKNEKHLRMHLAGRVVSSLTEVKLRLINKYHSLVEYISGLDNWAQEEQKRLGGMIAPSKTPCIPLLTNEVLDAYFQAHKVRITQGLHLYDLAHGYQLSESDILQFKVQIRNRLIDLLKEEYRDFSMVEYVTGKTNYPYLGNQGMQVAQLMPLLDRRSDCFLQLLQTGVSFDDLIEKSIFIHTDKQADRNSWRDTYTRYFSTKPADMELSSPYKLIELQVMNLTADQVALLR